MQIIIPMTGLGNRFKKAGYKTLKPLILVEGKPIIEHVVNLYPGENDFLFIVRDIHAINTPIISILNKICPVGKIKVIKGQSWGLYTLSSMYLI